ncbi:MAG: hypothetical protein U0Y10_23115 [Spirosomataceae bacterium]
MKKTISVIAIALIASVSAYAQRPADASYEKFKSLSPEQQAQIQAKRAEARTKWEAMTPEQRTAIREKMTQQGGNPYAAYGRGSAAQFNSLSPEKQAEINAMREKIKAMTPEERKTYFQNGGGRPRRG